MSDNEERYEWLRIPKPGPLRVVDDAGNELFGVPLDEAIDAARLGATVEVETVPTNRSRMLAFEIHFRFGQAYERYTHYKILKTETSLKFGCVAFPGGAGVVLLQTRYELWVDKALHSFVDVLPGAKSANLPLRLADLAHGEHRFEVRGHPMESPLPIMASVDRGQPFAPQTHMWAFSSNWDYAKTQLQGHVLVKITPAKLAPKLSPLPVRATPPLTIVQPDGTLLPKSALWRTDLITVNLNNVYRPCRHTPSGIISTANRAAYDMEWKDTQPRLNYLDGPRGRGTLASALNMDVGRKGSVYFTDGPRWGIIETDTWNVRTLFGRRHKDFPSQWEGEQDTELVGIWDGIPAERQTLRESWRQVWRKKTLEIDESAPPEDWVNGEPPHKVDPELYWVDSFNRFCKTTFNRKDRSLPPVVVELAHGLMDPWSLVELEGEDGIFLITERTGHRITRYDMTGENLGVELQGQALAYLPANRRVMVRSAPLATVRAGLCVGPEDIHPGKSPRDIEFGSGAMAQILNYNLDTKQVTPILNITDLETTEGYVKYAKSKGHRIVSTWRNTYSGYPRIFTPDGRHWDYAITPALSYSSSAAIDLDKGRIFVSTAAYGLTLISLRLPTDVTRNAAKFARGKTEHEARGMLISHPEYGWNAPLPDNLSDDHRYYLEESRRSA